MYYTLMDIPFWSMIPAFTESGKERENLSALARSCAGVGSALITVVTIIAVKAIGTAVNGTDAADAVIERTGFKYFSLIVAVLFIVFTIITCLCVKEKSSVDVDSPSVKDMFKALFSNDQALTMVYTVILVNTAFYITSNLVIYFFKYDIANVNWQNDYTLFSTFGGAMQILAMMLLFPLLRKFINTIKIFYVCCGSALAGYLALLLISFCGSKSVYTYFIPEFFIFSASGIINVLITIFLANTVDYGELINNRRDESIIFSMQTFVVKLASEIAALIASLCLSIFHIGEASVSEAATETAALSSNSVIGLRATMTIIPVIMMAFAIVLFHQKYSLTDEKLSNINRQLEERKAK